MNKALLYKARVSDTLPADGQGLIYRESSGLYGPEDISGGGGSSRIFNEKLLTAGDITAGYKDMVDPFPEWTKDSEDAGYGTISFFGKVAYFSGAFRVYKGTSAFASNDGKVWNNVASLSFSANNHAVEVFNGALYLADSNGSLYKSTNGTTFALVSGTGQYPSARNHMASCVFGGKLWLTGGSTGGTEVYSSADGEAWELVTSSPGWSGRQLHGLVVHNNKMFIIGGFPVTADVYSSTDGETWTLVTSSAAFGGRTAQNAVVSKYGKLWIIGGYKLTIVGDYWYSADDGATWQELTGGITPGRYGHCMFDAGDELIVMGGQDSSTLFSDLWSNPSDVVPVSLTPAKVQAHLLVDATGEIVYLRNQARAIAGATSDFVADGSRIYFDNEDGKTNLSGKPVEDDILIVEQLP
jgi:hypothetical protein